MTAVAVSLGGLAGLVAVAVAAGILVLDMPPGRVRLRLRRGRSPRAPALADFSIDISEGWLVYLSLALLAWLAGSEVAASQWVPRSSVLAPLAVAAVAVTVVLAKIAPRGTTYWLAVEVSAVSAIYAATANHALAIPDAVVTWVFGISRSLQVALLVCLCGATWLVVAWTTYWVVRRHRVPVALAPMAVVLAAEVINDPGLGGEYPRVAAWIVLAVLLSLRLNVARLGQRWGPVGAEQVSWATTLQGGRALALVVAAAFLLPPLSTVDFSARLFSNRGHGQLPGVGGTGPAPHAPSGAPAGFAQTGYAEQVQPAGTLTRTHSPVLRVAPDTDRLVYWRGIDLYQLQDGAWTPGDPTGRNALAARNAVIGADQGYVGRQVVHARVQVLGAPTDTVFWPGEPRSVSVPIQVRGRAAAGQFQSVDGAYALNGLTAGDTYDVSASISIATAADLEGAGSVYPDWVRQVTGLDSAPRINSTITSLAATVTSGSANQYDRVKAIETYLRKTLRYKLDIPAPPAGIDPVNYFLFTSHVGYCEYFASSMGEMVRSLGIPVRLVNGYGPGEASLEQQVTANTIRASDAHTWVEVFFPRYGWVPFEPTPDPLYPAIDHGSATQPVTNPAPAPVPVPARRRPQAAPGFRAGQFVPGLVAAAIAAAGVLVALSIRGRRQVSGWGGPWRRLGWLGLRLGVPLRASDTPLEFSRRLAAAMPEVGAEIVQLGRGYSRSVYAPATPVADAVLAESWQAVRARLVATLLLGPLRRGAGGRAP